MASDFPAHALDSNISNASSQPSTKRKRIERRYPPGNEDHYFGSVDIGDDNCSTNIHSNVLNFQTAQAGIKVGQFSWNIDPQPSLPFSVPPRQDVTPNQVPVIMVTHHGDPEISLSQMDFSRPRNMNDVPIASHMLQFSHETFHLPSPVFSAPAKYDFASTLIQSGEMEEQNPYCHGDPRCSASPDESELMVLDSEQKLVCFGMVIGISTELENNFDPQRIENASPVPVKLHSSGAFTALAEPSVQGRVTTESLKIVQGLAEEPSLSLQTFFTMESQPSSAYSNRKANPLRPKACTLTIILYGPMDLFDDVGEYLQQHGVYLQDPKGCDRNVLYCNPHKLLLPDGELYPWTFALEHQTSDRLEGLPRGDDLLEVLNTSESLCETPQPIAIKAELGSHQKQALTFMIRREKGWAFDGSWPDIWEAVNTSDGFRYANKISHAVQADPPPQFSGGIIADPMGLGKTLTMLALIASDTNEVFEARARRFENQDILLAEASKPLTLIVVPLSLLPTWEEQLTDHIHEGALKWRRHYGKLRLNLETESLSDCDIVLTTYQTLSSEWRRHVDLQRSMLYHIPWRRVVLDEAHVIRNSASQVARAICALEAESRWAVTGTPLQNRLSDLATLLKFLRPYPYGDSKQFDADIGQLWKARDLEEAIKRLKRLMRCLVLRRPKTTIDLPERQDLLCPLDFGPAELSIYQEAKARALRRIDEALFSATKASSAYANALQQINTLRMICNLGSHYRLSGQARKSEIDEWDNHAQQAFDSQREFGDLSCHMCKLTLDATERDITDTRTSYSPLFSQCAKFICASCTNNAASRSVTLSCGHNPSCPLARVSINDSANRGEFVPSAPLHQEALPTKIVALVLQLKALQRDVKCIVFSYWRSTLDLVESALGQAAINNVRFDGSLPPKDRQNSVDKFRKDPSVRVMLLTLSCGSVGLTLTVATYAYLMEPHWNPTVEEQALARIHRIGQTKPVTTIRFFIRDTLEEHVIEVQKKKKHLADVLLSSRNDASSDVNASRLEWLRSLL